ncbi:MAG: hypothetical protein K940chlam3_00463 [Chlamydiae bacterium]|nr:hypothetical protein [Chlamydiota bacterium]
MSGGGGFCRAKTELRWMRFVDGENFVHQGSKFLAKHFNCPEELDVSSPFFLKEHFLWLPAQGGWSAVTNYNLSAHWPSARKENSQTPEAIRAYYYTVVSGDKDKVVPATEKTIWEIGFTPRVLWKKKGKMKSKAVDSSISVDMLSAAYENQFDLVEIWTGDADYIPLVNAVKRLGKIVVCCFFNEDYGLSQELRIACDRYCDISDLMLQRWQVDL